MNLPEFHTWLMHELPSDTAGIADRLATFHRLLPSSYAGFPKTPAEVAQALRELAVKGLVVQSGDQWRWLDKPVKVEPQRSLFA